MANISAADVNKLRQTTGAGMMDCKKALVETEGDFEKAIDLLRKKGQKIAANRADRESAQGCILAKTNSDHTFGAIVLVSCETDFVAKNEEFVKVTEAILNKVIETKTTTIEEAQQLDINGRKAIDLVNDQMGKTGEKCEFNVLKTITAEYVASYNHFGNGLSTLAGLSKKSANIVEVGHDIVMQIAAMAPVAVSDEDCSQAVLDKEFQIAREKAVEEGKPEAILDKIANGAVQKFLKDNTLVNQEFIKDGKLTVKDYLQKEDKELKVTRLERVKLG